MTTAEVAAALRVTPGRVRQLAVAGELEEGLRVAGRRLYKRADVERFKRGRAKAR